MPRLKNEESGTSRPDFILEHEVERDLLVEPLIDTDALQRAGKSGLQIAVLHSGLLRGTQQLAGLGGGGGQRQRQHNACGNAGQALSPNATYFAHGRISELSAAGKLARTLRLFRAMRESSHSASAG